MIVGLLMLSVAMVFTGGAIFALPMYHVIGLALAAVGAGWLGILHGCLIRNQRTEPELSRPPGSPDLPDGSSD